MSNVVPFDVGSQSAPLPFDYDIERSLLGAILVNNDVFWRIEGKVHPADFASPLHGRLFGAMAGAIQSGRSIDLLLLRANLDGLGAPPEAEHGQYVANLVGSVSPFHNPLDHARFIAGAAIYRSFWDSASASLGEAYQSLIEGRQSDALDRLELAVARLRAPNQADGPIQIATAMDRALLRFDEALREPGRVRGVTTGLTALDDRLGGLHRAQLVVLAARPGMGKTALALSMARAAAETGVGVLFFSLEMHADDLAWRLCADLAWERDDPIVYERAEKGYATDAQARRLYEARVAAGTLPLMVDDRADRTVSSMRATAKAVALDLAARGTPLGLVIVDHIGLVRDTGRHRNAVHQVGEISRDLKVLAKDMNVPVLALCQLNRGVENREDKRPNKSDLRDSGAIEQDSDVILFPFREIEYLRKAEPDVADIEAHAKWRGRVAQCRHVLEIDVAKQRMGPQGRVDVFCDVACNVFRDVGMGY